MNIYRCFTLFPIRSFFLQLDVNIERMHAAKECKASSVLSKFKEMEKRVANGEELEEDTREYPDGWRLK